MLRIAELGATQMKLKSAIFNTAQVQALQRGERVTVRRVIKPQPHYISRLDDKEYFGDEQFLARFAYREQFIYPPYAHGEVAWVRERRGIASKEI